MPAVMASPTSPAVATDTHGELERALSVVQADTAALVARYEATVQELLYEKECHDVMVEKLAEIRVRRMQMYLRVPEDGRMLFMEETKRATRRIHPGATRREIRRFQEAQWAAMATNDQKAWSMRLHALENPPKPAKDADTVSLAGSEAPATKKKTAAKRKARATAKTTASTGEAKPKKRRTSAVSTKTSPVAAPAKKVIARTARSKASSAKKTSASALGIVGAPSRSTTATASESPARSSSSAGRAATKSTPRSSPTKTTPRSATKAKKTPAPKRTTALAKNRVSVQSRRDAASDDDDDDDDDDIDDESASSAAGSASDDDSDEHMAELPTGAFG